MRGRLSYPLLAGAGATLIAGTWLVFWFIGDREFVALRMKTNTCVSVVLLGVSLVLHARGSRRATFPALGALSIGVLTLLQYPTGIDLGIDELLVRDAWTPESAQFPNRMAPTAALGIILLGAALPLLRSAHSTAQRTGQWFALASLAIGFLAVVGYAYDVVGLYQPTRYIRISFSTSSSFLLLSSGLLASRTDVGFLRLLTSAGPAGMFLRRMLPVGIVVPLVLGWAKLQLDEQVLTDAAAEALGTVSLVALFTVLVGIIAAKVDELHRRTSAADRAEALTEALSLAATVDEVAKASLETGVPALQAKAGALFVVEAGGLRFVRAYGHPDLIGEPPRAVPLESDHPSAQAARDREAVFQPGRGAEPSRVHLPLEGRGGRVLGVLELLFGGARVFDRTLRARLQRVAWHCGQALDRALLFDSEIAARARAESSSHAKDQFLAMLGHELRNPLSPILTALELMKRGDPTPRREREIIERQVQHMVRLVDDLLDVSRITRGKVTLQKEILEMSCAVRAAVELVGPLLEQKRHRLQVEVPQEGVRVHADPARLAQVLANLLNNAAKYTPPGGNIEVRVTREGDEVVARVRDDGHGISPELLPRMFDLFVQGDQSIDRSSGGLGLGLAIAKTLTGLHGGTITATSDGPGKGSELTVRLPSAAAPRTEARSAMGAEATAAAARRVLVVDDNVDAATTLSEALRASGHTVHTVHDGPTALAVAHTISPDVVFLDIGLPVVDGFEVARRLRAAGLRTRLIAVTGYGQPADRERALEAGFDHHLVKPVPMEVVLELAALEPAPLRSVG